VVVLFLIEGTSLPESFSKKQWRIVTVTPNVMKRITGIEEAASTTAAAEVQIPEQVRNQMGCACKRSSCGDARSPPQPSVV
jgi:hypothetical protein